MSRDIPTEQWFFDNFNRKKQAVNNWAEKEKLIFLGQLWKIIE